MLLYFYTPPKPLISKLFNHDISPGLSLSCDSRALRCRRRLLFLPPILHSPTLRYVHYDLEKNFKRRVARFCRFTTRRILGCAKLPDIFFHSTKSPPLADIRRRTLIFLARSFSFSLSPANIIHSLLLSFSPSVHTPTLSLSL